MALSREERLLAITRATGIFILIAIPILLLLYPANGMLVEWPGGRWIWTLVIAMLPLLIVSIGFHRWREICPMAFFARLSEYLGWPDRASSREADRRRRRVPKWVARHYPAVTWGFLAVMLTLRLLLINSDVAALALTFLGMMLLASLTGFLYTGKSWCNFFCPVSTIELIYTDGDRPNGRRNSQCRRCTGCKTRVTGGLCPDINQEQNYWQEIQNPARAFAYYALPGLILGFYLWYFLHRPYYWHQQQGQVIRGALVPVQQPGTIYDWGYYLSGDWTRDPRPWTSWLLPGFGFHGWPYVPTVLAAPLTLALCSALCYGLFRGIEALWVQAKHRRGAAPGPALETVRHRLFAWAGFTAFTIFYSFAGAPTLRHLPLGLYSLFQSGMLVLAAWVLRTRLERTSARQRRADQARKWVKKWPFPEAPPTNLDEAYWEYVQRTQLAAQRPNRFEEAGLPMLPQIAVTGPSHAPANGRLPGCCSGCSMRSGSIDGGPSSRPPSSHLSP